MEVSKLKETEKKVLDVYQKVNPSTRLIESDDALYQQMFSMRERLFFNHLKLPRKLFNNARLLSLGCGTGEYEIFYGLWGCDEISCVEMNEISLNRLLALFSHYNLSSVLKGTYNQSYFDVKFDEQFDFVVADGTIVHTEDPLGAVDQFCKWVADDGFLVIGTAELSGTIQRNLQRAILYLLAGNNEDRIVEYARLLFPEHIERSVRFGKRSEEVVIYDTYVNPKIKAPSIRELLRVFAQNGISFYSSYPMVAPFVLTDSFRTASLSMEMEDAFPLFLPHQIAWLLAEKDDGSVIAQDMDSWRPHGEAFEVFLQQVGDVDPDTIQIENLETASQKLGQLLDEDFTAPAVSFLKTRLAGFRRDLDKLIAAIRTGDAQAVKDLNFERFMKGTCGIGHMYLTGVKTEMHPLH